MAEYAFNQDELVMLMTAQPVRLYKTTDCIVQREAIFLALETSNKAELDLTLARILNTSPNKCIEAIAESRLSELVQSIALSTPVSVTLTAKRLSLLILDAWVDCIEQQSLAVCPGSPVSGARGNSRAKA